MIDPPTKRRRWPRISLRALAIFVGIAALLIAIPVNRANRQRRAVERLQAASGVVSYDYSEWPGEPAPKLAWLRRLLGIHYFDTAITVFFMGPKPKPSDLKILADLPGVILLTSNKRDCRQNRCTSFPICQTCDTSG